VKEAFFKAGVLERYIGLIMGGFFPESKRGSRSGHWNFRCNVCGDSKKTKSKKRAWILTNRTPWMFYCHNCFESIPAEYWMKLYFNSYYQDYRREVFKIDIGIKGVTQSKPLPVKKELSGAEYNEYKDARYFKPIFSSNDEIFQIARKECARRLIPLDIWKKWFVAVDGIYRDRLVIPYYDKEGKIYSYQCRSLRGQEPKYLSRIDNTDNIYNYYNVDPEKPVIILEGAIDSIFIENAIGCTGLKVPDERINKFPHRYYLLDKDEAGLTKSLELLNMHEYVFMWKKFLKMFNMPCYHSTEKDDINALIIKMKIQIPITFEKLKPFFTNNSIDRTHFVVTTKITERRFYESKSGKES